MARLTRAKFLKLSALALGWPAVGVVSGCAPAPNSTGGLRIEPDLVLVNARVLTMAPSAPRAEAFAVKNGRFVAVGSSADVRNLASARTQVIDAGGQTLTPGFIDAHCHVSGIDELFGVNMNVRTVKAVQDALQRADTLEQQRAVLLLSCAPFSPVQA